MGMFDCIVLLGAMASFCFVIYVMFDYAKGK